MVLPRSFSLCCSLSGLFFQLFLTSFNLLFFFKPKGVPTDKQQKILAKIGQQVAQLHENCKVVEKDIAPLIQQQSDIYKKIIAQWEEVLKNYVAGLKNLLHDLDRAGKEEGRQLLQFRAQDQGPSFR